MAAVLHLNTKFIKCIAPNFPASLYSCVLGARYRRPSPVCGLSGKPPVQAAGRRARRRRGRTAALPGRHGRESVAVSCVRQGNSTQGRERSGLSPGNPGASVPRWGQARGPRPRPVGCLQVSAPQGQLARCREHRRRQGPHPTLWRRAGEQTGPGPVRLGAAPPTHGHSEASPKTLCQSQGRGGSWAHGASGSTGLVGGWVGWLVNAFCVPRPHRAVSPTLHLPGSDLLSPQCPQWCCAHPHAWRTFGTGCLTSRFWLWQPEAGLLARV